MEINGSLSFLPKSQYAPVTPADIGHKTEPAALMANVIIDGVVMKIT